MNRPQPSAERRVLMLGTFGLQPKGTMSARAAGVGAALQSAGWRARIITVPWDNPIDAATTGHFGGVSYRNTRFVNPALWPLPVLEMIREARSYRPDFIYLFKPKGFGDLAARWLRRLGYPVIVDMDDWEGSGGWNDALPYSGLQRAVFDWQERTWPRKAAGITAASRTLVERAIALGADPSRTWYLPNGLSESRLSALHSTRSSSAQPWSELDGSNDQNILLYTRFVEFDPRFVIQIMTRVIERVPGARLVVAGGSSDGTAEPRLSSAARRAGIADRITTLGWISGDDLAHIASHCDAALVPFDDTLINRAKCSVKVLELMACGLPIVASAVGENRQYLDGGRYGLLATPHDADSHAGALASLLSGDRDAARELGRQARKRACSEYRWDSLASPLMPLIDDAIGL